MTAALTRNNSICRCRWRRWPAPRWPVSSAARSAAPARTSSTILGVTVAFVASVVIFVDVMHGTRLQRQRLHLADLGRDCSFEIGFLIDRLTV